MIIGNGDIANALREHDSRRKAMLYFASGVSNSLCDDPKEFKRERDLLLDQHYNQRLIYFSTLSIYYKFSPYVAHKIQMERIAKSFPEHCIIRLGNIDWGRNPNTIINYFKNAKKFGVQVKLEQGFRFVVSKKEFLYWMDLIPNNINNEMNIPGKMISIKDLYESV